MKHVLVIGYGNTLRRDDGAGPAVACRFEGDPRVRVLTSQQLVPELADEFSQCDRVVFIDAIADMNQDVSFTPIALSASEPALGHVADPGWLLGMTRALHGHAPEAWLLAIRGDDFGFGEDVSSAMATRIDAATERLRHFLDDIQLQLPK